MPGFRLSSPNPFWFEDLVFFVMDEARRLPAHAAAAAERMRRIAEHAIRALPQNPRRMFSAHRRPEKVASPVEAPEIWPEAELLDEPLAWALATEPLVTLGTGAGKAIELHEKAREQLNAISYVFDRLRDDLAPTLVHVRLERSRPPQPKHDDATGLDTSIEALLALSRRNAATRPKNRVLSAA